MREDIIQGWEKVKNLYIKEFEQIPEIKKAWIRVEYCKHCGAMDTMGELDIVFNKYSLDMKKKMKDIDNLIGLQSFPLRFKLEHYGTEKYIVIRDGSKLFYFPDKIKEYGELENIICECSEMDLLWDEDGTYISQTTLDPDYYTILGKVENDEAEVKRYAKCHKEVLAEHGYGFDHVDGNVYHHENKCDMVECRFRTWKQPKLQEPKLDRTVSIGRSDG